MAPIKVSEAYCEWHLFRAVACTAAAHFYLRNRQREGISETSGHSVRGFRSSVRAGKQLCGAEQAYESEPEPQPHKVQGNQS